MFPLCVVLYNKLSLVGSIKNSRLESNWNTKYILKNNNEPHTNRFSSLTRKPSAYVRFLESTLPKGTAGFMGINEELMLPTSDSDFRRPHTVKPTLTRFVLAQRD